MTSTREQALEAVAQAVQYWLDNDKSGDLANVGRVAVDALAAAGLLRDDDPQDAEAFERRIAAAFWNVSSIRRDERNAILAAIEEGALDEYVQRAPRGGEDKTRECARGYCRSQPACAPGECRAGVLSRGEDKTGEAEPERGEESIEAKEIADSVVRDPEVRKAWLVRGREPLVRATVAATLRRLGVVAGREQASREQEDGQYRRGRCAVGYCASQPACPPGECRREQEDAER